MTNIADSGFTYYLHVARHGDASIVEAYKPYDDVALLEAFHNLSQEDRDMWVSQEAEWQALPQIPQIIPKVAIPGHSRAVGVVPVVPVVPAVSVPTVPAMQSVSAISRDVAGLSARALDGFEMLHPDSARIEICAQLLQGANLSGVKGSKPSTGAQVFQAIEKLALGAARVPRNAVANEAYFKTLDPQVQSFYQDVRKRFVALRGPRGTTGAPKNDLGWGRFRELAVPILQTRGVVGEDGKKVTGGSWAFLGKLWTGMKEQQSAFKQLDHGEAQAFLSRELDQVVLQTTTHGTA